MRLTPAHTDMNGASEEMRELKAVWEDKNKLAEDRLSARFGYVITEATLEIQKFSVEETPECGGKNYIHFAIEAGSYLLMNALGHALDENSDVDEELIDITTNAVNENMKLALKNMRERIKRETH